MNPAVTHRQKVLTVYKIGAAELDQTTGKTVRRLLGTVTMRATIQPATKLDLVNPVAGRAIQGTPMGILENAVWFIWTMRALEVGWWVKYGGELYRVDAVEPRHETGHTKAVLGKLGDFDGEVTVIDGDDNPVTLGG